MLAVIMCYIMLQAILHDGIRRAEQQTPAGDLVLLDCGSEEANHQAG